jgi:preprotein translocase subunit SecB
MTDEQDNQGTTPDPKGATGGATGDNAAADAQSGQRRFLIQKIYLKDVSFESPAAPGIFSRDNTMEPKISLQLNTESRQVGENLHEITLIVTVTSADDDRTAFLVEVKQAGLFEVSGFADLDHAHALGSYCPSILFPYAREVIAGLVQKGGFPQLALQPINFDALFAQQMQKQRQQAGQGADGQGADQASAGDAAAPAEGNR